MIIRCSYCGSGEHSLNLCPKTYEGYSARLNLRCSYCGSRSHSIRACPKTAGPIDPTQAIGHPTPRGEGRS